MWRAVGARLSPPDLMEAAGEWTPAEIYWILKHGIKMSAMPSFGSTHSDADLWKLAGFVKRLPTISPQTYAAIEPEQEEGEEGHPHVHSH
jgi:mono/diheme cytochrome c family protein